MPDAPKRGRGRPRKERPPKLPPGRPHKWDPALGPLRQTAIPVVLVEAFRSRAFRDAVVATLRLQCDAAAGDR